MSDDKIDAILAKQKAAAERRRSEQEELERREAEKKRHEQQLLESWAEVRNAAKKVVFDLNKIMAENGIALSYKELETSWKVPHSAHIRYEKPFEYSISGTFLGFGVDDESVLTVRIALQHNKSGPQKDMTMSEFDEATIRQWALDFLERTADV